MKSKLQVQIEAKEVYNVIKNMMAKDGTPYVQSWWLNKRNCNELKDMNTRTINQRCKLLVKQGYLKIDQTKTSSSTGTSYLLTEKVMTEI